MNIYALELARLPNTSLEILVRLAKTLVRDRPSKSNVVIDKALAELIKWIARAHAALVARVQRDNPSAGTSEVDFDLAVDGLWILLRKELELAEAYGHRGLAFLDAERAEAGGLAERRAHARRARAVWERLFAASGTSFTKARFISQAEAMATLLRLLDQEQLRAELDAIVGPELPRLIDACQAQYEDMVDERLSRSQTKGPNLREARDELRWALVAYVNAVHTLLERDKPETSELVLGSLGAILSLREALVKAGGEDLDELDELVELDFDEAFEDEDDEAPALS